LPNEDHDLIESIERYVVYRANVRQMTNTAPTLAELNLADLVVVARRLQRKATATTGMAKKFGVVEEYDWPGDSPVLCGYLCLECKALGDEADGVPHESTCPLSQ
jgi:hypothetical protein